MSVWRWITGEDRRSREFELDRSLRECRNISDGLNRENLELEQTIRESEAELVRAVQQASDLALDNKTLREQLEAVALERDIAKNAESERWVQLNSANATINNLKSEIALLTAKKPRKQMGG